MKVSWTQRALKGYAHWQAHDRGMADRITELIADIKRSPFRGLGKPEALKYGLKGCWSRRITGEHRLVYRVSGKGPARQVEILQCRYHYTPA